jgi:hypothetical protein
MYKEGGLAAYAYNETEAALAVIFQGVAAVGKRLYVVHSYASSSAVCQDVILNCLLVVDR